MCLRKLQRLKLGWCINLPAEEFAHLGTLTTLRELHLTRCGVNDECLGKLGGLADLRILSLAGCPIADKSVDTLLKFQKLKDLNLEWCTVPSPHLAKLGRCRELRGCRRPG